MLWTVVDTQVADTGTWRRQRLSHGLDGRIIVGEIYEAIFALRHEADLTFEDTFVVSFAPNQYPCGKIKWSDVMKLPFLVFLVAMAAAPTTSAQDAVYVIRHAEKELSGDDPAITEEGKARASAWAEMLARVQVAHKSTVGFLNRLDKLQKFAICSSCLTGLIESPLTFTGNLNPGELMTGKQRCALGPNPIA